MNTTELSGHDSLDFAGNMLERHNNHDVSAPGLLEVTGITTQLVATASGLNDYDYQNISTLTKGLRNLNQLVTVNKVPIPPEIMEHFKHIKCHCMMGLFPEIGRAWLTIDSDIYIWTYEESRDVAYFDGLSQLIVSVGLVVPKPGIFTSDCKYLLVLTTPIEIVVLGITFGDATKTISSPNHSQPNLTTFEEMLLTNKPLMVLNTDNIAITTIEGSANGRIFMGGRDGCLYELTYQGESNWFGKHYKKVNHSQGLVSYMIPGFLKGLSGTDSISKIVIDNSRQLLFVLTEKGAIEAWDIGPDANSIRKIARLSQSDIESHAATVLRTVDSSVFKPVTTICAMTMNDSSHFNLLALTQSGVRFYFSTNQLNMAHYQQQQQQSQSQLHDSNRANGLYLLHVRLPPGYTPNTTVGKPKVVHSAFYDQGSLLMASTPQQDQDFLWSMSSEPFPQRPYLAESSTVMPLDGQVWAMAAVKSKTKSSIISPLRNAQIPKQVVLLTNQGAHIVALLKPVDLLQQLLLACHGPHNEAVKSYFQVQSEVQACASSLLLACLDSIRGTEMVAWATQAFLLYGGDPMILASQQPQQMGQRLSLNTSNPFMDQQAQQQQQQQQHLQSQQQSQFQNQNPRMYMSTPYPTSRPASSVQQSLMQQTQHPISPINPGLRNPMIDPANITYSAKHASLYLHMARLLRPFWSTRCVNENLCSNLTTEDCGQILEDLYSIKRFLDTNSVSNIAGLMKLHSTPNTLVNNTLNNTSYGQLNQNSMYPGSGHPIEDALIEERKSLDALNKLIKYTCEVMELWKIMTEHQFTLLITSWPKEQQTMLCNTTFRDLVLCRPDLCALIIKTLITAYLNDDASVSSISSKLRDNCQSLYRQEDAVCHQASEIIVSIKTVIDPDEREEKFRTALKLCKSAAPNLALSNMCQQFTLAGFYQGVIELCGTCAEKFDPNGAATHFYKNGEPAEDQEGFLAYSTRMECYKEIKLMLEQIYQNLCNSNTNLDLTKSGIVDESREKNINNQIFRIVALALQSSDNLLHIAVYDWLLSHNLLSELLGIAEPSLGEYLGRSVARTPDNLRLADLLWKYYERKGQHSGAAKILENLATMPNESISLMLRIEYLARAVMCMRSDSVGYSAHNGVLLKDLEDKLEIAQVQKKILDDLSSMNEANLIRDSIRNLNTHLYTMSQLYSDFAERYDLWECKLTILNCSHHNDQLLIESVWTQILDKEIEDNSITETEKCRHLLSKVQNLANEYGSMGHCFPLPFIVRELELRCFRLKIYSSPVPLTLVDMNLDIDVLLDIYLSMISMNERVWLTDSDELYLVRATSNLLSIVPQKLNTIAAKNRRRILAKTEDLISACLNLLYQKPDTQKFIDTLRETQAKLQRLM